MAVTWTESTDKPRDIFGSLRAEIGLATLTTSSADVLTTNLNKIVSVQATNKSGGNSCVWVINKDAAGAAANGSIQVDGTSGDVFNVLILGV